MSEILLGTTYSTIQANNLHLPQSAFDELLDLKFNLIRIGTYWSSIQKNKDEYDFTEIKHLLNLCEERGQKIVLTVGMKGPRWPEFYIPKWLENESDETVQFSFLKYLGNLINELKSYSSIQYWQVENEPLDPSGPENKIIPHTFLQKEVQLVKQLDNRLIVTTVWGNDLSKRNLLTKLTEASDIIGIDLYYKQFLTKVYNKSLYRGPADSDRKIKQLLSTYKNPIWIMELQAEPWEQSSAAYKSDNPKSMNSKLLQKNYNRVLELQPEAIFLWGYEYWYYKKKQGNFEMWNGVRDLLKTK